MTETVRAVTSRKSSPRFGGNVPGASTPVVEAAHEFDAARFVARVGDNALALVADERLAAFASARDGDDLLMDVVNVRADRNERLVNLLGAGVAITVLSKRSALLPMRAARRREEFRKRPCYHSGWGRAAAAFSTHGREV